MAIKPRKTLTGAAPKKVKTNRTRVHDVLEHAIDQAEKKLKSTKYDPSFAEFCKLVQLMEEFEDDTPKEVLAGWVDRLEKFNSEE